MSKQRPFTWVMKFTVSPTWVADGFSICDERARNMLANAIGGAYNTGISAQVLSAPSALSIAEVQGYAAVGGKMPPVVNELEAGTPDAGKLQDALIAARDALQETINGAPLKLTHQRRALKLINKALELIDSRQGDAVEVE